MEGTKHRDPRRDIYTNASKYHWSQDTPTKQTGSKTKTYIYNTLPGDITSQKTIKKFKKKLKLYLTMKR